MNPIEMNPIEAIERVQALTTKFGATGQVYYLDEAIAMAEDLAKADPPRTIMELVEKLLAQLVEIKSSRADQVGNRGPAVQGSGESGPLTETLTSPERPTTNHSQRISQAETTARLGRITKGISHLPKEPENHPPVIDQSQAADLPTPATETRRQPLAVLEDRGHVIRPIEVVAHSGLVTEARIATMVNSEDDEISGLAGRTVTGPPPPAIVSILDWVPGKHGVTLNFMDTMQLVQGFEMTFHRTGDIDYLTNAIGLAQGADAKNLSPDFRTSFEWVICRLFETRNYAAATMVDFEKGIEWGREAVAATPSDHPRRAAMFYSLGAAFLKRFLQSGELHDLGEAVKQNEEAIKQNQMMNNLNSERVLVIPEAFPDRTSLLIASSTLFHVRFLRLENLSDLGQAIERIQEAATITPLDSPDRAAMLQTLRTLTQVRSDQLGDLKALEAAIIRLEKRLVVTKEENPLLPTVMHALATLLSFRYDRLNDIDDLERAITLIEKALFLTQLDCADRATLMHDLGNCKHIRFQRFGVFNDIEEAIKWCERGIVISGACHPALPCMLYNLGTMFRTRFERFGDLKDLVHGIDHNEEAVETTPPGHRDHGLRCYGLANLFRCRFDRLGFLLDLEIATKWNEQAIALSPSDHDGRPVMLDNLGTLFHCRYQRLGDVKDLEQAMKLGEETLAVTPASHPKRARMLFNLATMFSSRFTRFRELDDVNSGIMLSEAAVTATPADHPHRSSRLSEVAEFFRKKFERLGVVEDLELAIKWSEAAVTVTPPGHPDRPMMLNNLGIVYYHRFKRFGAMDGIELAIKCLDEAAATVAPNHPNRALVFHTLGTIFCQRFQRLGLAEDLEKGIKWSEKVVLVTPSDHPERACMVYNLGSLIYMRFIKLGAVDDLELAVNLSLEAQAENLAGHPQRVDILSLLSRLFRRKYDLLGNSEDLESAIQTGEEAVATTSPDHPNRARNLTELGLSLVAQLNRPKEYTGKASDSCFDVFLDAWHSQTSPPQERIRAAFRGAAVLVTAWRWQEAGLLLEQAVKILPKVSPRILTRGDQKDILSEFNELVSNSVSVSLQGGSTASHCLPLLELGRGIITGFVIDCRSDLSDLEAQHPGISERFKLLRSEIDSPFEESDVPAEFSTPDRPGRHRRAQAAQELDQILDEIRQLPGFDWFLLPPAADDLMTAADEGPIVIFNSTQTRSDAIIVTTSGIHLLILPEMRHSDVTSQMEQVAKLARGNPSTYPSRNRKMEQVLLWLWDVAVGPVFEELGFGDVDGTCNLPRIWWIGVGLLGMAPFHAAGDHSVGSTRNTISRAISSYIPTIKSLSYARQKKLELLSSPDAGLLLVTMPTTPGERDLWSAPQEAADIVRVTPGRITLGLDHPSTAQVLEKLPAYHAIHFACHGVSHGHHPSQSHLLLVKHDPHAPTAQVDKLTVGDISGMNLKQAQLAYLSGCQIAGNSSTSSGDESIHIASGFQLAGFSHVLATLWESQDDACRQVAVEFYRLLFNGQHTEDAQHRAVSTAFHHAVKKIRDDNLQQPLLWASFIHTGA